ISKHGAQLRDLLKVLKGAKDMADFIIEKIKILEMFGIVTSGYEAKILSIVNIPSGIYLAIVIS
ncbi:14507_t:CDS:2, partial [Entrophospora sp. SA101]